MNIKVDFTTLIEEIDYGTPASKSEKQVTLTIDGRSGHGAGRHLDHARRDGRRASRSRNSAPPTCSTRSAPAASAWSRSKGAAARRPPARRRSAKAWWCRRRPTGSNAIRRGVMELYISDHPTRLARHGRQWRQRVRHGRRVGRPARDPLRHRGRATTSSRKTACARQWLADGRLHRPRRIQSLFHLRSGEMHRLLALRARLRGGAGHLRADHRGPRLRIARRRPACTRTFIDSECVSCGACVQACPTDALREKSVLEMGKPEHSVVTTCAYCGVGCSFKAEMRGDEVVRMVPWKDGKANRGHSCVKGRFAYGYATHKDRILNPMIREKITDPWREVTWDEAIAHVASEFRRIQYQYGRGAIGGITSSRCTNEETYLVQKLVRAGLRQQQCRHLRARLPFADRLRPRPDLRHLGRHAGFRLRRAHRRRR